VKMPQRRRTALIPLLITVLVIALAMAFGATAAFADSGGMSSMPGMTDEQMQNMTTPAPAPTAASGAMSDGSMSAGGSVRAGALGPAMDPHMDMGGGSVNWFVIGGFIALVVGSTIGAVLTKRHLARRMASGALAGAGALDV
jgi:hypothetical protein